MSLYKIQDGAEELYDYENNFLIWKNLAEDKQYEKVRDERADYLPGIYLAEVPK